MSLRRTLTATGAAATLVMGCGADDIAEPEQAEQPPIAQDPAADDSVTDETGEGPAEQITMARVEENDTADSCWTAIDGLVYDVTDWVDQHPGGPDRIEQLCGTDGTENFTDQHSGAPQPESQLAEFQIGQLVG